jgi:solute carrier family 25 (mitochondrial carnitine/acylcarnitine transporter), member 20/29
LEITAAGFFSAIPQTFIAAPVERAKVVLQVRRSSRPEI